MRIDKKVQVN
ncbi:Protein of unknown function [Lactobacillus helveticus CIRM-BIA 951]|uniref:Uncharacterized protein n=1 Tax=Lactobacillus helveticus CIRM-BIA 951 TaxID=1226334 RepID=U6F2Y6_LACHE|nr:Protein of unknown function [Lactobacillus helveticus CIRM-BIA 951]